MEITSIQVYPLGYIGEYPSAFYRSFAFVKVQTEAGITGWDETSDCFGISNPLVIQQIVEGEFKRHLVGENPLMIERRMRFPADGSTGRWVS